MQTIRTILHGTIGQGKAASKTKQKLNQVLSLTFGEVVSERVALIA